MVDSKDPEWQHLLQESQWDFFQQLRELISRKREETQKKGDTNAANESITPIIEDDFANEEAATEQTLVISASDFHEESSSDPYVGLGDPDF